MILEDSCRKALKKRIGNSEIDDELADILIESAQNAICDLIGREMFPERLYDVCVELALIAYNRAGMEGESSRSEGGVSISFEGLSPLMLKRLENYPRRVGVIHASND